MSKTEVTQFQYQTVIGKNPSYYEGEDYPVESVTWYEAIEFCNRLSELEGFTPAYSVSKKKDPNNTCGYDTINWTVRLNLTATGYRLPTEAEWEFAAIGGGRSRGFSFSGSNEVGEVAWFQGNSERKTHEVATKKVNELGLFDMSGNVWEFCWDWFETYRDKDQSDPMGAVSGNFRVIRGASFIVESSLVAFVYRWVVYPDVQAPIYGFRVVLPLN